jgi:hypothetical protein
MIRFKDRIYSIVYRLLRSEASNTFNSCNKCKKRRKNWIDLTHKKNLLIGYDKILGEWVAFTDYNFYAKTWAMNGYIVKIYTLHEKLWDILKPLCRKCISNFLKSYVEPEERSNEAG